MKNLKPYGIPHSILFENIFAKTFDQDKLEEDKERIVQAYQDHGYFTAKTLDATVNIIPQRRAGLAAAARQDRPVRASTPTSTSRWKKAGCTTCTT